MKRARNLAQVDDLIKIIRANNVGIDLHKSIGGVDIVAGNFKNFFADCIQITPRLSRQQLAQAFIMVHPLVPKSEIDQFAGSLVLAFGHVRQKSQSMTSGVRTNPAVYELGQMLQRKPSSLVSSLKAVAKAKMKSVDNNANNSSSSSKALLPTVSHPMQWSESEDEWPVRCKPTPGPIEEIMSSQEISKSCSSKETKATTSTQYAQFLDMKACKMVRRYPDKLVEAIMKPGDSGYALACFGTEAIQTELPNLMLEPVVIKRPAAKAPKKKPAAAPNDNDNDDEHGPSSDDGKDGKASSEASEDDGDLEPKKCETVVAKAKPIASFTKENYKFKSLSFGECRAEFYSKKSYIRFFDEKSKKWRLLVGTQGDDHHAKLESLVSHARQANMKKEQLVSLRDESM